jgi:hypothetical protein
MDRDWLSIDEDLAGIRPVDPSQNLHESGLPGSVLTDKCQHFTAFDFKENVLEREHSWELLRDPCHSQDGQFLGRARAVTW